MQKRKKKIFVRNYIGMAFDGYFIINNLLLDISFFISAFKATSNNNEHLLESQNCGSDFLFLENRKTVSGFCDIQNIN